MAGLISVAPSGLRDLVLPGACPNPIISVCGLLPGMVVSYHKLWIQQCRACPAFLLVGLISVAPSGNDSTQHCRMAALPYPAYVTTSCLPLSGAYPNL
ncbi:hypothetical protein C8256_06250 [Kluyvera genomosp. 2]|uniref:Uncharacterized protein n=1 Tax=Kluyvera genomosp. 2 TaxID=2774054 RepID=A0A2T2Y5U4_9ENTR|nr:hypothetical protein C8256_06250 [Kluyvera genomosp. 2]